MQRETTRTTKSNMFVIVAAKVFLVGLRKGNAKRQNAKVKRFTALEHVEPREGFTNAAKLILSGRADLLHGVGFTKMVIFA